MGRLETCGKRNCLPNSAFDVGVLLGVNSAFMVSCVPNGLSLSLQNLQPSPAVELVLTTSVLMLFFSGVL